MPSSGISFAASKRRNQKLSQKPRTAATRRWEQGLGGLSLALHRIDKAASVARSRAVAKLERSLNWTSMTADEREHRKHEVIEDINCKRDEKRRKARDEWNQTHGDKLEAECNTDDSDQEIATNDDDMKDNIIEECASEAEAASDSEEEGYMSEAEEVSDNIDSGDEITEEGQKTLHERLHSIWSQQIQSQQQLLDKLEAEGKAKIGQEVPDDYEFGNIIDHEMDVA